MDFPLLPKIPPPDVPLDEIDIGPICNNTRSLTIHNIGNTVQSRSKCVDFFQQFGEIDDISGFNGHLTIRFKDPEGFRKASQYEYKWQNNIIYVMATFNDDKCHLFKLWGKCSECRTNLSASNINVHIKAVMLWPKIKNDDTLIFSRVPNIDTINEFRCKVCHSTLNATDAFDELCRINIEKMPLDTFRGVEVSKKLRSHKHLKLSADLWSQTNAFLLLPREIVFKIISELDSKSAVALSKTHSQFRHLLMSYRGSQHRIYDADVDDQEFVALFAKNIRHVKSKQGLNWIPIVDHYKVKMTSLRMILLNSDRTVLDPIASIITNNLKSFACDTLGFQGRLPYAIKGSPLNVLHLNRISFKEQDFNGWENLKDLRIGPCRVHCMLPVVTRSPNLRVLHLTLPTNPANYSAFQLNLKFSHQLVEVSLIGQLFDFFYDLANCTGLRKFTIINYTSNYDHPIKVLSASCPFEELTIGGLSLSAGTLEAIANCKTLQKLTMFHTVDDRSQILTALSGSMVKQMKLVFNPSENTALHIEDMISKNEHLVDLTLCEEVYQLYKKHISNSKNVRRIQLHSF